MFPDAPRVGDTVQPEYPMKDMHRSRTITHGRGSGGGRSLSRKRHYNGNDNHPKEEKRQKTRHSY